MQPIDVWYIPVIIPALTGALIAAVVNTFVKRIPWDASLSILGFLQPCRHNNRGADSYLQLRSIGYWVALLVLAERSVL